MNETYSSLGNRTKRNQKTSSPSARRIVLTLRPFELESQTTTRTKENKKKKKRRKEREKEKEARSRAELLGKGEREPDRLRKHRRINPPLISSLEHERARAGRLCKVFSKQAAACNKWQSVLIHVRLPTALMPRPCMHTTGWWLMPNRRVKILHD